MVSMAMLGLTSCGGGDGGENQNGSTLDASVAPITDGDWYRPSVMASWQWQLQGSLNQTYAVEVYDVDLFDTPTATIQTLQSSGIKVICYFSAGSYEAFREDQGQFQPSDLGATLDGWEDERWLDIRSTNVHSIMLSRMDTAVAKGCDGVEPDNIDGYSNNSGFPLSATDQLAYNKFLANAAHGRNLAIGLKNDLDQVIELVDFFDFAINEQCFEYDECVLLAPFIDRGKPVFNAEYLTRFVEDESQRDTLCSASINQQFSTLVLPLELDDSYRFSCI